MRHAPPPPHPPGREARESAARNPGLASRDHAAATNNGARPKDCNTHAQMSDDVRSPSRKPRHQAHITGFLRIQALLRSPMISATRRLGSTDVADECDTGGEASSNADEFQSVSPFSPETPTPKKSGKNPSKRKRKDKLNTRK